MRPAQRSRPFVQSSGGRPDQRLAARLMEKRGSTAALVASEQPLHARSDMDTTMVYLRFSVINLEFSISYGGEDGIRTHDTALDRITV